MLTLNEVGGWLGLIPAWLRPTPAAPEETAPEDSKEATCIDCCEPFLITAGEIAFLASKGWQPFKRCKACRQKKRMIKEMRFK